MQYLGVLFHTYFGTDLCTVRWGFFKLFQVSVIIKQHFIEMQILNLVLCYLLSRTDSVVTFGQFFVFYSVFFCVYSSFMNLKFKILENSGIVKFLLIYFHSLNFLTFSIRKVFSLFIFWSYNGILCTEHHNGLICARCMLDFVSLLQLLLQ